MFPLWCVLCFAVDVVTHRCEQTEDFSAMSIMYPIMAERRYSGSIMEKKHKASRGSHCAHHISALHVPAVLYLTGPVLDYFPIHVDD